MEVADTVEMAHPSSNERIWRLETSRVEEIPPPSQRAARSVSAVKGPVVVKVPSLMRM